MFKVGIKGRLRNIKQALLGYSAEAVSPQEWERSFSSGSWRRLEDRAEIGRYSIIVGYRDVLKKKRILDVGCGQGLLAERLKKFNYARYHGFDLSATAIAEAKSARADVRNTYSVGRAEDFETSERFDLVVFNEIIYYLDDPVTVINRYGDVLGESGHLLVSMYDSARSRAAWRLLDGVLHIVDGTTITHMSNASWIIKIASLR